MDARIWLILSGAVTGALVLAEGRDAHARTVPAGAIEQTQDLYVHTVTGTNGTAAFFKAGKNFDGGEASALMRWNIGSFPNPIGSAIGVAFAKNLFTLFGANSLSTNLRSTMYPDGSEEERGSSMDPNG